VTATATLNAAGTESEGTWAFGSTNGTLQYGFVTDSSSTDGTSGSTNGGTTPEDPVGTAVVSPTSGTIEIDEAISTDGSFGGYWLFDTVVRIEAPDATAEDPLELTFTMDASATGGEAAADAAVFRNGILVNDCTGAPAADPDPCVSARVDLPGGGIELTVLTSTASTWAFGSLTLAGPASPTNASALPGNGRATVSWTAPSSDGGSPITGYEVTSYVGYTPLSTQLFSSTATTQLVTGLTNGWKYRFRVRAINAAGTGPYSTVTNAVIPAPPTAPSAPTNASALPGDGRATVSWTAPSSDGGSPITGYEVTSYVGYNPLSTQLFSSTATTQLVTGLTNGWKYRFRVRAINAAGNGPYSTVTNPVTPSP
jgi:hypothetical protein